MSGQVRSEWVEALVSELKRLKTEEGSKDIFVSDAVFEGIDVLRRECERLAAEAPSIAGPGAFAEGASPVPGDSVAASAADESPLAKVIAAGVRPAEPEVRKPKAVVHDDPVPALPDLTVPPGMDAAAAIAWLQARLREDAYLCRQAGEGRVPLVGEGPADAGLVFLGDVPSVEDTEAGHPFRGEGGVLLRKVIQAMGLKPESVFLANLLPWRPLSPAGDGTARTPTAQELAYGLAYVDAQLAILKPKVIVAMGLQAVAALMPGSGKPKLGDLRGRWFAHEGIPFIVTYSPAYLIHNNTMKTKRVFWEDMLSVMERTGMPISEKQAGYFKSGSG